MLLQEIKKKIVTRVQNSPSWQLKLRCIFWQVIICASNVKEELSEHLKLNRKKRLMH